MKKGFNSSIQKVIDERQKEMTTLQNEITELRTKADGIKDQLQSYSDIDDIDTYSRLKNQLEVYENRIELLVRNMDNMTHTDKEDQIKTIYDSFRAEASAIDEKCSGDLLDMIKAMKKIFEDAETEKNQIDNLFDKWRDSFSIEPGQYSVSPCHKGETYVVHHVKQLFDALRQRNILV